MPRPKLKSSEEMLQMLSRVDIHSSVAVYLQIENHVQIAISSGRLSPTDRLPSVRELSERLEVNANTVAKAYRDLEIMGLLYTRRGKGVFVRDGIQEKCRKDCLGRIVNRMHGVVVEARAAGMSPKVINEIVSKCSSSKSSPYLPAPSSLLKLATKSTRK